LTELYEDELEQELNGELIKRILFSRKKSDADGKTKEQKKQEEAKCKDFCDSIFDYEPKEAKQCFKECSVDYQKFIKNLDAIKK
jgi:hypothetical protein